MWSLFYIAHCSSLHPPNAHQRLLINHQHQIHQSKSPLHLLSINNQPFSIIFGQLRRQTLHHRPLSWASNFEFWIRAIVSTGLTLSFVPSLAFFMDRWVLFEIFSDKKSRHDCFSIEICGMGYHFECFPIPHSKINGVQLFAVLSWLYPFIWSVS